MDNDMAHSLLDSPLVTVRAPGRKNRKSLSLPELLSELPREGTIGDFPRVAAHQRQALHAFLVQLAAMALHRAGDSSVEHPAERWREMLVELADGEESAFALVVSDLSKPAFFQPPVPEGEIRGWKVVPSSVELDVVITADRHDVKAHRSALQGPETWLYALICLQTYSGYSGLRKYGIARMNTGHGSRPEIAFLTSHMPGHRFVRETHILLNSRTGIVKDYGYKAAGGHSLLWNEPWTGMTSLGIEDCDPFFIEVCRRVRFTEIDGVLRCQYKSTKAARVAAKERKGVLGDPWIPVENGEKALTVSGSGFTYDRVQRLLTGNGFDEPAAQTLQESDPSELLFLARVLVRGQGKTEGFHERFLRIPATMRRRLFGGEQKKRLGVITQIWVEHAAQMKTKVLKPALLNLVQGGPDKLDYRDTRVEPDLVRFEAMVDQRFFDVFFSELEAAGDDLEPLKHKDSAWGTELLAIAQSVFEAAIDRVPIPDARYYRAVSFAQRFLYGGAKKNGFPIKSSDSEETSQGELEL